jgi:DNA-binding NarL/FixJ family response regulator
MKGRATKLQLYPAMAERVSELGRRGQVLEGMWAGKSTKEIAADLGVSPKTVEYHRAQLYRLFGVNNPVSLCRRGLAVGAIRLGAKP